MRSYLGFLDSGIRDCGVRFDVWFNRRNFIVRDDYTTDFLVL